MSRHHHRFERDYRGPWERRDIRPSGLHNGGANHSCASAVVNGNNRPGLLPLPVIPSLLPTPVTVAVTTSSSDIAVKRGITAAGSVTSATAKVRALPNGCQNTCFPLTYLGNHSVFPPALSSFFIVVFFIPPCVNFLIHEDSPTGHNLKLSPCF